MAFAEIQQTVILPLDVILDDFRKLGYRVEYRALNAADFGVPQNRIRIIIVGIRDDLCKQ